MAARAQTRGSGSRGLGRARRVSAARRRRRAGVGRPRGAKGRRAGRAPEGQVGWGGPCESPWLGIWNDVESQVEGI